MELVLFITFGLTAVAFALLMLFGRNPLNGALSLIVVLGATAALFAMLGAWFIAVMQIAVYGGAIMMLFIFVLMLLNVKAESYELRRLSATKAVGVGFAAFMGYKLVSLMLGAPAALTAYAPDARFPAGAGTVGRAARLLFGEQLLSFQLVGPLLLVAMIGAVVLARKRF